MFLKKSGVLFHTFSVLFLLEVLPAVDFQLASPRYLHQSLNLSYERESDIDNDIITPEHSVLSLLQRQHINRQTSKRQSSSFYLKDISVTICVT